ncbi:unnamed protein product [Mytilus coruscus]|uniref:DDE Tnp4 domain-containing protein n=1 Tax=Mytilus coruscus TaxID=42192 RepID=A0A6J7ZVS2_MYTCO|nr:unnamed protein product [Mytilus coruscus]
MSTSRLQPIDQFLVVMMRLRLGLYKASSLVNQSLTFSSYKHHNTLKFLVGITPPGVISFVSEGWGRRVSDRELMTGSGILDLLEPGDGVMADKGFTITDLLEKRQYALKFPQFRGVQDRFTTEELFQTQEIAQLCIHVERRIGRAKNFHILEGVLPLSIAPVSTKIFQTCCWLTNLNVPLVQDDKSDL